MNNLQFCVDSLIVKTILQDGMTKNAEAEGMMTSLINKIKEYVSAHIDPNNKVGSLVNILGPGVITMTFSAMGLKWLGALIGLAMRVFNIDVNGVIGSIWEKLKNTLSGDKKTTSSRVDNIVQESIQEHYKPATPDEIKNINASKLIRDARIVKLSMIEFQSIGLVKQADLFSMFNDRKSKTASILTRVLSWVFKVALASAGLMVAGDVVNKFLNRPNAFDHTIQQGKPVETEAPAPPSIPVIISKQTKFPIKSGYTEEKYNVGTNWMERIPNESSAIEEMLINFAKTVYDKLEGREDLIKTSAAFQIVRDRIIWYNHTSPGTPFIFIPKYFTSKKQIVDLFIDDIASKVK